MLVSFQVIEAFISRHRQMAERAPLPLDRVAVIILGGGEGKRLDPLTKTRCKPAVSFGGRYTLIDVPISHALSSGLKNIFVIGQYLAYTLQKHLFQSYLHHGVKENRIQLLVPEEKDGRKGNYKGTADAIRQNLNHFAQLDVDYFLILSGDHLYNIDFQEMIRFGIERDAGMVIAAQPVNGKEAKRMGLLKLGVGETKLVDFVEKPQEKEVLEKFRLNDLSRHCLGSVPSEKAYLGSMGIYFFKKKSLIDLLQEDPREDFGKHLIMTQMEKQDVHAYLYDGYWEDIGTIESYYRANLALTEKNEDRRTGFRCYDDHSLILTKSHSLPGAAILGTLLEKSLICEGSVIEAEKISQSIIGVRSIIRKGVRIFDSILMGNEFYESPSRFGFDVKRPEIGEGCVIQKAIIDENVRLGRGVHLLNEAGYTHFDPPSDHPLVFVRDGIVIVPKGACLPDGFVF